MTVNVQTPEQTAALAAYRNNTHDVESMLHHLQDLFAEYCRDAAEGREALNAEIMRDLRAALLSALEATGLDRDDIEDTLAEQREFTRDAATVEAAVDPVEPYGMCEPCEI